MSLLLKIFNKLRFYYWQIVVRILFKIHGVVIGKKCEFFGIPIIVRFPGSRIILGDRVVLCSHTKFTDLGLNHPIILRTITKEAEIFIDSDAGLSGTNICAAKQVTIGKEALIGANVTIFDTDFHTKEPINRRHCNDPNKIATGAVIIKDNVFIGTNALICKGVTIGENSIIGAGSVVVKDVEASKIYAGNPAREIGNV
ncbi:DapH/DapD/GlmU-related protein [Methylobacter sp. S3L5C]|uniref:acyltransferase n=1 Tax=Methylobacter sp. S3L5C TaxID=2839024 RepID=UPI001FAE37FA|nr:acyltransferase [Methylobacter sp. S3L5C]UOA08550.1 acyltransferase [Methylobacter sp. S3L5C]